jgi:hypothetical protein
MSTLINTLSVIYPMREMPFGISRIVVNDDDIPHGNRTGFIAYHGNQSRVSRPRKTESNIRLKDRPVCISFTFFQSPATVR